MLKVLDLFSGIGGFSLGLERCKINGVSAFETVAFCEIEKFPQKVLKKHWPDVPIYEDVRNVTKEQLEADGITGISILTGGFPCQDISVAGKQAGIRDGDRSSLFDEIIRLARDIRPRYVICENVAALLSGSNGEWFSYVLTEFSRIGYDVEWESISAQEVGAWHKRDRVWIIAYPMQQGLQGHREEHKLRETGEERKACRGSDVSDTVSSRQPRQGLLENPGNQEKDRQGQTSDAFYVRIRDQWESEPSVGRVANGIPDRSHRLKGLGNAVVPQIPELIGRAILEAEHDRQ